MNLLCVLDDADLNDSGTGPSTLRRRGSDGSGSLGGSLSRLRSLRSQFSLNTAGTFRKSLAENIPDLSQLVNTK